MYRKEVNFVLFLIYLLAYVLSSKATQLTYDLDKYMPDINTAFQSYLTAMFELLTWGIALAGSLHTIPPEKPGEPKLFSMRKVFHYVAAYGGFVGCCYSISNLLKLIFTDH